MLDRLVGLIDPRVDLAILACAVFGRILNFIELKIDFPVFGIDGSPPTDDNLVGLFIISDESTDIISGVLDNRSISQGNIFAELAIPLYNLCIGAMRDH